MTKRYLIMCLLGMILSIGLHAENKQQLIINGETVAKVVAKMTFEGDNVILHFSDETQQTAAMSSVVLSFEWSGETAIYALKNAVGNVLDIDGLAPGTIVSLYDAAGHCLMTTTADEASAHLSTQSLKSGVYLLKADKQVVKFVKK